MDVFKQLDTLKEKYPDEESTQVISDWEKNVKIAILTSNIRNHDGMKLIIEKYQNEIRKINNEIDNPRLFETPEGQMTGRLLHARREWCKDFLKIFDIADQKVAGFTNLISNKLLNNEN